MDPVAGLDAVTIDCLDPSALAGFWAAVFGTEVAATAGDGPHYVELLPIAGIPILRFQRVPVAKSAKNRLHLDLTVDDLDRACAAIEAFGGRRVTNGRIEEYGYAWVVLQDPEGNEFCVAEGAPGM
jgi:predicted enzyme related to lactoylglutathione lyase